MKISFCGAASGVTGSCHLIETDKYNKALKEGVFLGDGVEGNLLRLKEEYNV